MADNQGKVNCFSSIKKFARKIGLTQLYYNFRREVRARCGKYDDIDLLQGMERSISVFCPDLKNDPKKYRQMQYELYRCRYRYQIKPIEYFLFHFDDLNDVGRKKYIGNYEKWSVLNSKRESSDVQTVFLDKLLTYQTFRPYYKRQIIEVKADAKTEFLEFAEKNPRFIIKERRGAKGLGIRIVNVNAFEGGVDALFDTLTAEPIEYIAEELINQNEAMRILHPLSVNTVRFVTYLSDGKVNGVFSFLRMGKGNSVIDNATTGGLSAAIDLDSGIVKTPACSEDGEEYLVHPDTGVQVIGMHIPNWSALLELVDMLARVVPEQKYVGWDLALTDDGWIMVEGNDSAMMTAIQMLERRGLRDRIKTLFGKDWNLSDQ